MTPILQLEEFDSPKRKWLEEINKLSGPVPTEKKKQRKWPVLYFIYYVMCVIISHKRPGE